MGRLREEKERVIAAATDELEVRRRAKRNRHLRTRAHGVETTGTFSGPTEEVADLLQVLKPLAEAPDAPRPGRRNSEVGGPYR